MRNGRRLLLGSIPLAIGVVVVFLAYAFPPPQCNCARSANGTVTDCPPCALVIYPSPFLLLLGSALVVSGIFWLAVTVQRLRFPTS
ncbi:MAG: hypothetical protein WCB19_02885 [Thermoplasmata archaeon]